MKTKNILLLAFFLVVVAQLAVPLRMILHNNDVLKTGKIYKFKTEPIDPHDPFRGKFIRLYFKENHLVLKRKIDIDKDLYAIIANDKKGFARIIKVSNTKPKTEEFLKVKALSINEYGNEHQIWIEFPFERFYMNEYKASEAEKAYNESSRNQSSNTYAVIAIKNGEGIIKDVMIDDISINEYLQKNNKPL